MTLQRLITSVFLICLLSLHPAAICAELRWQEKAQVNGSPSASELTNDDVIRLVKAGLGEEMVVLKIKQSKPNFDLSPEALIKLKEMGLSDAILKAMLNSGAPAAAPAAAPTLDPGIYLEEDGKLIQIEPTIFTQTKGNMWATGVTYGIKKAKFKAVAPGPRARVQTAQSKPVFHFSLIGNVGGLMGATSPNEFLLVRLDEKKDRRELVVGEARYGVSMGVNKDAIKELAVEKLSSGRYRATPKADLQAGEYCFYYMTPSSGPMGGAGGKLFDFRVTAAH